jgi:hypothetical protein
MAVAFLSTPTLSQPTPSMTAHFIVAKAANDITVYREH